MWYLRGGTLLTPDGRVEDAAVLLDGERIVAAGPRAATPCPAGAEVFDAYGLIIAPGFIDLQFNGGFGCDFTAEPRTIWEAAARLPASGVTAFLPTIITAPLATSARAQQVLRDGPPSDYRGATALGLHIEGPFLNPAKRGAHSPAHLRLPSLEAVADWSTDNHVRLVTLAPELPGALDVIGALRARGVVVSAGHSLATLEEAQAGFDAGIGYGTHLFNAMPALEHRAPGLVTALLTNPAIPVGVLPDGIHVHPAVVKLIWQSVGPARFSTVTDAMAALGMPPGRYLLGDTDVIVDETRAQLSDGRLAGSIISMDQAVRNVLAFTGCSLSEALATVTTVPACLLGLSERGRLAPGCVADVVALRPDHTIAATWVKGQRLYPA
jgi:N-acetylglucosamine-6-phosphate deacetylase